MNRSIFVGLMAGMLLAMPTAWAGEGSGPEFYRFPEKETPTEQDIRYAGARPLFYGGLLDTLKAFTERTGHRASAMAGGCGTASKHLKKGKANLGGFCCPLIDAEQKQMGWIPVKVARDFIPVIVHPSNPLTNLTFSQLQGIFRGKIVNWKDVGGPDKPIVVVVRNHCKSRQENFRTQVAGKAGYTEKRFSTKTVMEEAEMVGRSPYAIGVLVGSRVVDMSRLKVLAIDGVSPTRENLLAGRYPLVRDISVVTRGEPNPATRDFIQFLSGPEGQTILKRKILGKP